MLLFPPEKIFLELSESLLQLPSYPEKLSLKVP